MLRSMRLLMLGIGLFLISASPLLARPAAMPLTQTPCRQADRCVCPQAITGRYYSETGQTTAGEFAVYWEVNGGLPVFGFPISNAGCRYNRDDDHYYLV